MQRIGGREVNIKVSSFERLHAWKIEKLQVFCVVECVRAPLLLFVKLCDFISFQFVLFARGSSCQSR